MNINYYDLSESFLLIGIFLIIVGGLIITIISEELEDCERYRLSKLSTIVSTLFIVLAITLIYFSHIYGEKYRKNCYEQCAHYLDEVYHVHVIDYKDLYSKKGSVYVRGGDANIETYFYNAGNLYYVEYELRVLSNGIIKYQNAQIYGD